MTDLIKIQTSYIVLPPLGRHLTDNMFAQALTAEFRDALNRVSKQFGLCGDVSTEINISTGNTLLAVARGEEHLAYSQSITGHYTITRPDQSPTPDDRIVAKQANDSNNTIYKIAEDGQAFFNTGVQVSLLDLDRVSTFGFSQVDRTDLLATGAKVTEIAVLFTSGINKYCVAAIPLEEGEVSDFLGEPRKEQTLSALCTVAVPADAVILDGDPAVLQENLSAHPGLILKFNLIGTLDLVTGIMNVYAINTEALGDSQPIGLKVVAYKTEVYRSKE